MFTFPRIPSLERTRSTLTPNHFNHNFPAAGSNSAKYAKRRNRPERHSSCVGSGQNIIKLYGYVPANESDLFKSVRLEPRLILFLVRRTGGLSAAGEAVVAVLATDFSELPVLDKDDESDLDMVRRVPTIIGNTAVNLIRLLDKNPPPPPPQPPGPVPPPAGGSIVGSSSEPRIQLVVFTAKVALAGAHTRHVTL